MYCDKEEQSCLTVQLLGPFRSIKNKILSINPHGKTQNVIIPVTSKLYFVKNRGDLKSNCCKSYSVPELKQ